MRFFSLPASLFFGLPLMTIAAFMAADVLHFHWTRELHDSDLVEVAGMVERTQYVPVPPRGWSRNPPTDHTDVWLKGYEHPFRFTPAWPCLNTLPPGTPLSVRLDPDAPRPPQPSFLGRPPRYRPLTVLLPDGWWNVHLLQDNRQANENIHLYPWLSPCFALLGLFMSTYWFTDWCERQARSKYQTPRKPLKGRLSLRRLEEKDEL